MPQKLVRFFAILGCGVAIAIALTASFATIVKADTTNPNNPTTCEFQPLPADRSPTTDNIIFKDNPDSITKDNSFVGLHRWNQNQWPGVDYLANTTVAFKNGGVVSWVGYDGAGGGNSIIIDGQGACKGWRQFFGHLGYDPTTIFSVGQSVSPDEIVGRPGCSGYESNCNDLGEKIPAHNHVTLGYWSNVFNFQDKTVIDSVDGFWWIHPSRVEGISSSITTLANTEDTGYSYQTEYISGKPPSVDSLIKVNGIEQLLASSFIFQKIIIVLTAAMAVVTLIGIFYSHYFRESTAPYAIVIVLVFAAFIAVQKVYAINITSFSPPRESVEVDSHEVDHDSYATTYNAPATPITNADCSLSSTFPEKILRWCGLIETYARAYDLEPKLVASVMLQESGGNELAISKSGAIGLLQVMPRDGKAAEFICANGPCFAERPNIEELKDPEFNIKYGTQMLAGLIDRLGSVRDGLKSYGPRDVDYYYADIILAIYDNH